MSWNKLCQQDQRKTLNFEKSWSRGHLPLPFQCCPVAKIFSWKRSKSKRRKSTCKLRRSEWRCEKRAGNTSRLHWSVTNPNWSRWHQRHRSWKLWSTESKLLGGWAKPNKVRKWWKALWKNMWGATLLKKLNMLNKRWMNSGPLLQLSFCWWLLFSSVQWELGWETCFLINLFDHLLHSLSSSILRPKTAVAGSQIFLSWQWQTWTFLLPTARSVWQRFARPFNSWTIWIRNFMQAW